MGDKEFEKLFNSEDDDDGSEELNTTCHQRLMLDVLANRSETITDLFQSATTFLTEVTKKDAGGVGGIQVDTIRKMETFLEFLTEQSRVSVNQMDYLVSRIIDELDPDEEDGSDGAK